MKPKKEKKNRNRITSNRSMLKNNININKKNECHLKHKNEFIFHWIRFFFSSICCCCLFVCVCVLVLGNKNAQNDNTNQLNRSAATHLAKCCIFNRFIVFYHSFI